jgi:hypothetical protein
VKASLCGQHFHSMGEVIELSLAVYYNCQNTTQMKANLLLFRICLLHDFGITQQDPGVYKIIKSSEKLGML